MRVCFASYQAVSILHGGPRTQMTETMRHLREKGVDGFLFDSSKPLRKGDLDLFHLFAANIGTYHLAREIHALGIPLVVSPIIFSLHSTRFVRTGLACTRLAQRFGKGIWTDYSLASDICSWAGGVIPNTHAEANLIVKGLGIPSDKLAVVPNGVDERFASADPSIFKETYGLDGFILNVGHIGHERKNVLRLIRALGRIDHPSVIIGRVISGAYGDACVAEASKYKQIRIIDGLDHDSEMLASAYAAAKVFVLPSLFETPGIAALEAGIAGARIVITPHGGTREYFGDHAIYVNPFDVQEIRRGIETALSSPDDHRLREHIRREYVWSRVAEKTLSAYERFVRVH